MIFASVNMSQHTYLHPASKNEGWSFSSLGACRQQAKQVHKVFPQSHQDPFQFAKNSSPCPCQKILNRSSGPQLIHLFLLSWNQIRYHRNVCQVLSRDAKNATAYETQKGKMWGSYPFLACRHSLQLILCATSTFQVRTRILTQRKQNKGATV